MTGSFLFSVFVFLAAACLLVPISKRLGLGAVIGYLVAGVVIGPFALKLIDDPETILHFSEFGVVMMLFLIGLELRPSDLWKMRGRLLGLGGAQVGVTLLAVAGVAYFGGAVLGTAIAIGMALALSSTAVGLRIMEDRAIMLDEPGRAGFSVLLFQDVIVIAMIASIPLLAGLGGGYEQYAAAGTVVDDAYGGPSGPQGWVRIFAIFGVFAGMILAGRLLLRPILRFIAAAEVRETFTAVALLVVVGAALLMGWLGLSTALGAFFAGVVLADSEYRHQLERDIEPFKSLLLGLFFISVGMSLNLETLAARPGLVIGATLGLMALKFVILFGVGKIAKLSLPDNLLFAALLCQAGEFGFVLFQFARIDGVMDEGLITLLSAIVALSMAFTPLLLLIYDKLILPRLVSAPKEGEAPRDEENLVLILGYGRVGQIVERLLSTQGIEATLIDKNADHIHWVKRFGNRVYYGDGGDMDLLRIAGAERAKVIVLAQKVNSQAARDIQVAFPNAKIIARARSRFELYELMEIGVDFVERDTVRCSLAMGQKALEYLGMDKARAERLAEMFLEGDNAVAARDFHLRGDIDALAERAAQNRALIQATMESDEEDGHDRTSEAG